MGAIIKCHGIFEEFFILLSDSNNFILILNNIALN